MRSGLITLALLGAYTLGTLSHASAGSDDLSRVVQELSRMRVALEKIAAKQ
jgi:hypothetical protein